LWLAGIVAVALAVRLAVLIATPDYRPISDSADYDTAAVTLVEHGHFPPTQLAPAGGPSALRPPLFELALAGVDELVGVHSPSTRWTAGRVLEAVLGAAVVALILLIALRLWGRRMALVSGGLAAVAPPLVLAERPRRAWRSLRAPLTTLLAAVVVLVPWTVRNAEDFHTFVPLSTEGGYVAAGTYNSLAAHRTDYPAMWIPPVAQIDQALAGDRTLNEARLAARLDRVAIRYAEAHPGYVAKLVFWNGLRMFGLTGTGLERLLARSEVFPGWLAALSVYSLWVLASLAVVGAVLGRCGAGPVAFWVCPALLFASAALTAGTVRYGAPVTPFVIMLAALAVDSVAQRSAGWALASRAAWSSASRS
jgi:hypothetical protein